MPRFGLIIAAALLAGGCARPQAAAFTPLDHLPALSGGYFPLHSRQTGHLYHIYVRLPDGYAARPGFRYPIVYVLDGDSLFPLLAASHLFLTLDDKLPEAIVVGIAYGSFAKPVNNRHVDFMPPGPALPPGASGAAAFHAFLERELLPAVETRFRADPARRVLFGQSRGGGMVLYSAFTRPDLFWGRIASNPSLEPGREIFFGEAAAASRNDLKLVVASGTHEDAGRRRAHLEWFRAWEARPTSAWTLKRLDIENGTHAANSPDVYRRAMHWLFGR